MRSVVTPRLAVLSAAHFTIDSYSSFFTPLLPLLVHKLGLSLTLVGTLVALASLTSSFSQPLFGLLADRLSRPWFVAFGPLVAAVFLAGVGLAPSYGALVTLLMLGGLGVAAFHPQSAALAAAASPRRGLGMSFFITGGTVGWALGPLFSVTVVSAVGLERSWLAAVPGVLLCALLFGWFTRAAPVARAARAPTRLADLLPFARPLAVIYFAVVFRSAVSSGFATFLPLHLSAHGWSVQAGGWLTSGYLTAGALGGFLGGWLSDRIGGRRVVVLSYASAIPLFAAFLLLPLGPGLPCLLAGYCLLQLALPVNVVLGQELVPRHAGTVSSLLMGFAWGVGALFVGPVGWIADHVTLAAGLAALATLLLPGLACALALPDPRRAAASDVT
jgi:FSR family fosmidomycin resistance protein-like MFS transporter